MSLLCAKSLSSVSALGFCFHGCTSFSPSIAACTHAGKLGVGDLFFDFSDDPDISPEAEDDGDDDVPIVAGINAMFSPSQREKMCTGFLTGGRFDDSFDVEQSLMSQTNWPKAAVYYTPASERKISTNH